jgi:acetyltransferase-like isoleucine patch superfamily enzyme
MIGNDIRFAQNITLSGLNHNYEDVTMPIHVQGVSTAQIIIEDDAWIGANVVVVAGVTIGKHSIVAAGSIVTKDIPPFSVAVGNPARVLKQYNHDTKTWEKF